MSDQATVTAAEPSQAPKGLLAKLDHFWRPVVPAERLATLRILVGGFAVVLLASRLVHFSNYSRFIPRQFRPIGVTQLLDGPLPLAVPWVLTLLTLPLAVAFTIGWRFKLTGPLFAALLLWITTYRNSWGMIFHTENLLMAQVLVLALAPACARVWSFDARRMPGPVAPAQKFGWPIVLMCALTTLSYTLAGVAKLRASGLEWVTEDVLRIVIARDNVTKAELGSIYSPIGMWLAGQVWLFRPLAAITLVVEIAAPIALLSRRIGYAWVATVWGFHMGVVVLMAIFFPFVVIPVGFACFFEVERLGHWARRKWIERRARKAAA